MAEAHLFCADDVAYLAGLVREIDRPRYFAALFAPEPLRSDLFVLYGFAAEIERIPDQVSDPTLGRIRLQWWRDSLADEAGGAGAPALRALHTVIARYGLPLAPFTALIEARDADLYSDPPATVAELEAYLRRTQSALFETGATLAGVENMAEPARHAGLAYGLARRLERIGVDRAHGRTILPLDLLAAEGMTAADTFVSTPDQGLQSVVRALAVRAGEHYRAAALGKMPRQALPVFLPLAIVPPLLRRWQRNDAEDAGLSDLEMLLRIGWARLRGQLKPGSASERNQAASG